TRVRGVELDGAFHGPLGLEWTAGATVLSLRVEGSEGPFISRTTLRPLTENIRLGSSGAVGPVRVSVLASRGVRAEGRAWNLLDSRLTTRLPFPGELFLDVSNLGDETYPDITGQRAPGRQITLGVRVGG